MSEAKVKTQKLDRRDFYLIKLFVGARGVVIMPF